MKKLLINSENSLIDLYFNKYKIWKDYNKFYNNDNSESIIEISPDGIPVFHYQDIENINNSASEMIAIDCLTEGLHSNDYFSKYNKDKHYLIFSNGSWSSDNVDVGISYSNILHSLFLFEMADTYLSPNRFCFYMDTKYNFEYPKPCIFTSLIGNIRPERDYVLNGLKEKLEYNNFILRYSGEDFGISSTKYDIINFKKGEFDPYTPLLDKYYHSVSQTLPIAMYNQSYVNVVVESDIDYVDNFFLTEKTIKSLIVGMPFIVVSTPNFLKNLQQLGFTTYNQLWDESYDSIIDYKSRVDAVIDLCNNLGKFDWESSKSLLMEIQLKNQNNFLNLNHVADREFKNFENIIKQL